jgi:hypothetical protein
MGEMRGMNRGAARLLILASSMLIARPHAARADDAADEKATCAGAAVAAQKLRLQGKLVEARAELETCARDTCPALVREDCRRWKVDVTSSVPTVVVFAKDGRGRDLEGVKVRIDGTIATERADGRPLFVNPGEHSFEYEALDSRVIRERIIIRAGDRNRRLAIVFGGPESPATPRPLPSPTDARPVPSASASAGSRGAGAEERRINPLAWVFYGVSGAALGAFAYLAATGVDKARALKAGCGQTKKCAPNDVSAVTTQLVVADVFLGVSAIAAGVATWLVLTPSQVGGGSVSVGALPGGASIGWARAF